MAKKMSNVVRKERRGRLEEVDREQIASAAPYWSLPLEASTSLPCFRIFMWFVFFSSHDCCGFCCQSQ